MVAGEHVKNTEDKQGQQKIKQRACARDSNALEHVLAGEGFFFVFRGERFAVIVNTLTKHLYVSAEGDIADRIFGFANRSPYQFRTKAQGEFEGRI
jgi:hypothetical protein